jgi:hypothetical protein
MFPSPGMTVHPDWHRFLDNSFSTFDPNEYVALLLSEEQMDGDEYTPSVYVRIKQFLSSTVAYCILYDTTAFWQPVFYVSFLECTIQNVSVIVILLFLVIT